MSHLHRTVAAALLTAGLLSPWDATAQIPVSVGQGQETPSLAPLLKKITPSVVSIAVRRRMTDEELAMFDDPLFRDLLGRPPASPEDRHIYAAGSGVIIDGEHGYLVTGAHVVDGADEIIVILSDGRRLTATPVGLDNDTDIAVVKVRPGRWANINFGDSDRLEVGDFVLSIGNPFSIGQTVTSGIVSAFRKRSYAEGEYEDFIQTDAAINLGSSGGALVNLRGEFVGMNAAILDTGDPMAGNIGIGFAIPANTVRIIADQLIRHGSVRHGYLGVSVSADAEANIANRLGVAVTKIETDASAAGLKPGDIITAVNSTPIREPIDLQIQTGRLRAGDVVELRVLRNGRPLSVHATLSERKPRPSADTAPVH